MNKSIVLLAGEGLSTHLMYNFLKKNFSVQRVILEDPVSRSVFLRRRFQRLGLIPVLGQILFQLIVLPALKVQSKRRLKEIASKYGLDDTPIPEALISRVDSVNSEHTRVLLKSLNSSVIVVNGTRIISIETLQSTSSPFVNIHAGMTPAFRGVHGAYWAMAQDLPDLCGVTVHLVDAGIDTGKILAQALIHAKPEDNFATYPLIQLGVGLPLLKTAIDKLLAHNVQFIQPPDCPSRLWSHPTFWGYLWRRIFRNIK